VYVRYFTFTEFLKLKHGIKFSLAGVTYYVTSMLFPPRETMIEELIAGDDQIPQPNGSENITDEKSSDVKVNTQAV
jgi:hypothetical protein